MLRYVVLIILVISTYKSLGSDLEQIHPVLKYRSEGYINSYPEECFDILKSFAEFASNFTLCSILNARPIRLCEHCVEHYVRFHDKYNELIKTVVNGTSCGSLFMSHDRLNVVKNYHDGISGLWVGGNCNDCFIWNNGSYNAKNDTKKFYKMFNDTMECIVFNMDFDNNIVCEKCMQNYLQLDEFYKGLSKDGIGVDSVCMDIVDSMNATRYIWSKNLNCCNLRRTPEVIFLCCTGIISFLPIMYYLAVRFCGPIRDLPNVLKESRFKQSILRSINRRSD
ncbi:osteopetrosis-associated transmembrane protein 1 isoform X1 [Leptidea sinapis]|uniref:osteopetrosis-associated transmembrane protein 1 isoform X1 n=1 Tax=Leptidea sinapis TaxID=189913 RepID=UPI00212C0EA9|nr:osteopetrosis-associated transmembrane protein 1 isoform X1 [Leptidea sinapis]